MTTQVTLIGRKTGNGAFSVVNDCGQYKVEIEGRAVGQWADPQDAYDHCISRYKDLALAGTNMRMFSYLNAAEALDDVLAA
jgi:hypothetical protein